MKLSEKRTAQAVRFFAGEYGIIRSVQDIQKSSRKR